jgi:hypothetical protein
MREEGHPPTTTKQGFLVVRDLIPDISLFTNALLAGFLLGLLHYIHIPAECTHMRTAFETKNNRKTGSQSYQNMASQFLEKCKSYQRRP